jgi:hypothetical protein
LVWVYGEERTVDRRQPDLERSQSGLITARP